MARQPGTKANGDPFDNRMIEAEILILNFLLSGGICAVRPCRALNMD
jgi:hypothetical protein